MTIPLKSGVLRVLNRDCDSTKYLTVSFKFAKADEKQPLVSGITPRCQGVLRVGIRSNVVESNMIQCYPFAFIWVFPKIGNPPDGWFIRENPSING
jgi:hypothetical protein